MKQTIAQFLVQHCSNKYSGQFFDDITEKIAEVLEQRKIPCYLDSRSYTFANVDFIVYSVVSAQEPSPCTLAQIAEALKDYNALFSSRSMEFDVVIKSDRVAKA